MSIVAHRIAMREGRLQSRMKKRVHDWWHLTQCSNCQAERLKQREVFTRELAMQFIPPPPTSMN